MTCLLAPVRRHPGWLLPALALSLFACDGQDATAPPTTASLPVAQLAAGLQHSCARLSSGQVSCWGSNEYGELGDRSIERMRHSPAPVAGIDEATHLASFGRLSCATRRSGAVACWGMSARAAANPPAGGERPGARRLEGVGDAIQTSVGDNHLCILGRSGSVSCADGIPAQRQAERGPDFRVILDAAAQVSQIRSGSDHTCALTREGETLCWGRHWLAATAEQVAPGVTRVPGLTRVSQIAAGSRHTCVLEEGGRVKCWGYNADGQAGPAGLGGYVDAPGPVPGVEGAIGLAAGDSHTCAALATGGVVCWGASRRGQLGVPGDAIEPAAQGTPRPIAGLEGVRDLTAGHAHSCVILEDGSVACWGDNASGQSGRSPISATSAVDAAQDIVQISAGRDLCTRSESGMGVCYRGGDREPLRLTELAGITDVAAGLRHGCAVDAAGAIWCWGQHVTDGKHGEPPFVYGDGARPVRLAGIERATAVAVGRHHACGLLESGTVVCWGNGWLGDGESSRSERPVAVRDLYRVRRIAAGQDKTYALRDDGSAVCWGECGELGAEWQSVPYPTAVPGIDDARAIAVSTTACVIRGDGRVTCLGGLAGSDGGDDRASTLEGVTAIDVSVGLYGNAYACLVEESGRVACWGDNRGGQLGDGSRTPRTQPTPVSGIASAVRVSAGEGFACAILRNGGVRCWGEKAPGHSQGEQRDVQLAPAFIQLL